MPRSLYKGERVGKLPPCLICAGAGEGPRERLFLTHGVSLWLCAAHRSPTFLTRRAGRDFSATVHALWSAAGCLGARRRRALEDHMRRVAQPSSESRERPGSYAWPHLRGEAERRFAAGEAPQEVIGDIRARHRDGPAPGPSLRTLRRWFSEGRWLGYAMTALAKAARWRAAAAASRAAPRLRPGTVPVQAPAEKGLATADPADRGPPKLWS